MGLCKCPKRKTTSHFCFKHCVNVCEHCIINNHSTCVVKTYTTWLKEASSVSSSSVSASAVCAVCQQILIPKETEHPMTTGMNSPRSYPKTSIRLLCYHAVHVHCLSVYVKKQLKEGNILKCPSCTRSLWFQNTESDLFNTTEVDYNELPPVALALYKHLLNYGEWWGKSIITNEKVEDIEKYFLQDDENVSDRKTQKLFESQPILETDQQFNAISNNTSPLTLPQTAVVSSNSNQPIYHRHFNSNNYGIDIELPQEQRYSSINMTNLQSSDLSNRYTVPYATPLLTDTDNNLKEKKENEDPSGKKRPKKFKNPSWNCSYQCLRQFLRRPALENGNTTLIIVIIVCVFTIAVLMVVITDYTTAAVEPLNKNSIDYGGDDSDTATNLNSYNNIL
ncbi:Zinc finger, RING-type,Zinc finger, RING/FYVE/PHD-type [Cinara cedri]|uniref:Zinc finger protein-like 1 homolog n=1 Tax=Cinara cedri TaxID=506608 RepID=A0A5E4MWZ9_9HEMI|nr:Zinc finger, RING-type,Zinc finger, RING/FYVE/PHD-type [Cinara cedri]